MRNLILSVFFVFLATASVVAQGWQSSIYGYGDGQQGIYDDPGLVQSSYYNGGYGQGIYDDPGLVQNNYYGSGGYNYYNRGGYSSPKAQKIMAIAQGVGMIANIFRKSPAESRARAQERQAEMHYNGPVAQALAEKIRYEARSKEVLTRAEAARMAAGATVSDDDNVTADGGTHRTMHVSGGRSVWPGPERAERRVVSARSLRRHQPQVEEAADSAPAESPKPSEENGSYRIFRHSEASKASESEPEAPPAPKPQRRKRQRRTTTTTTVETSTGESGGGGRDQPPL